MNINYIKKDLLKVPQGYYIAHVISEDLDFSGEASTAIDKVFDTKSKIQKRYAKLVKGNCYVVDNVFNLVARPVETDKFDLVDINEAVKDMANYCFANGITKIAMPKMFEGLNKEKWESAIPFILRNAFGSAQVEILVCDKPPINLTDIPDSFNEKEFDFANSIDALIIEEDDILNENINGDIKVRSSIYEEDDILDMGSVVNIFISDRKGDVTSTYIMLDEDSEGIWFEKFHGESFPEVNFNGKDGTENG